MFMHLCACGLSVRSEAGRSAVLLRGRLTPCCRTCIREKVCVPAVWHSRGSNSSPSSSRPLTTSSLNPMMHRKKLFSCHSSIGPGLDRELLGVAKVCRHLEQCSRLSCSCEPNGELTTTESAPSIWKRTKTVFLPSSQVTGDLGHQIGKEGPLQRVSR